MALADFQRLEKLLVLSVWPGRIRRAVARGIGLLPDPDFYAVLRGPFRDLVQ